MNGQEESLQLFREILIEQRKTNDLLGMLIDALADEQDGEDNEPLTYMDGTPVHG